MTTLFCVYNTTHGLSISAQAEPSSGVIMYQYPVQVAVVGIDIETITMETETITDVEEAGGGKRGMN